MTGRRTRASSAAHRDPRILRVPALLFTIVTPTPRVVGTTIVHAILIVSIVLVRSGRGRRRQRRAGVGEPALRLPRDEQARRRAAARGGGVLAVRHGRAERAGLYPGPPPADARSGRPARRHAGRPDEDHRPTGATRLGEP